MSYYDTLAPGYNELYKDEQLNKLKIIKDNLHIKKTDKLLDVGCGTGFSLNYFDCQCVGIEPSKMGRYHKRIIPGVAEKLPFKDNTFDIVISITAIHNFKDIEKGLKEIKRVGKKKFAFSVLKRSKKFKEIKKLIHQLFKVKEIEEDKDIIFITYK